MPALEKGDDNMLHLHRYYNMLGMLESSVAEPTLFLFGSDSTFVPYSAPAAAPVIYCHFKLFYNSNTISMEVPIH